MKRLTTSLACLFVLGLVTTALAAPAKGTSKIDTAQKSFFTNSSAGGRSLTFKQTMVTANGAKVPAQLHVERSERGDFTFTLSVAQGRDPASIIQQCKRRFGGDGGYSCSLYRSTVGMLYSYGGNVFKVPQDVLKKASPLMAEAKMMVFKGSKDAFASFLYADQRGDGQCWTTDNASCRSVKSWQPIFQQLLNDLTSTQDFAWKNVGVEPVR
jgi:hypothetical protein